MNIIGRWPLVLLTIPFLLTDRISLDPSYAAEASPGSEVTQQSILQKSVPPQGSGQTYSSPAEAANSALELIKSPTFFRDETGGIKRANNLGFESLEEVAGATLGNALPVINVNLKQLRDFKPEDDPKSLVLFRHKVLFPIYVKSDVRSSLTVSDPSRKNSWVRMGRGSPILIRTIEKIRKQLAQPNDVFYLVENRGIELRFLARLAGEKITLVPLNSFSFGTLVLTPGEERPAKEMILALKPVARQLFKIYERRKNDSKRRTEP